MAPTQNWLTGSTKTKMTMTEINIQVSQNAPFIFIVGCPRSGTTLLQRMMDNHPQLTIANDTHFITRAAKRVLRKDPQPLLTPVLVEAVQSYRRFYRMGLEASDVEKAAENCTTYAEFVGRLYTMRAQKHQKQLSGEKTPDNCRKMPLLHSLFPGARFVHIIRDGRDTALSTLSWASESKGPGKWAYWKVDPLATCALWWRWQAGSGERDGQRLGKEFYHRVRYEELVVEPQKELKAISTFLDIPYSDSMVNYHVGKTRHKAGLSAKSAWLPPVKNLRDWRNDMSHEDIDVFEGVSGDLLRENGYECRDRIPTAAVKSRVARCLSWWDSSGKRPSTGNEPAVL